MDNKRYEDELRAGMAQAIAKLAQVEGFVLYAFNVITDPDTGVSAFSADTRANSDRVVAQMRDWQQRMVAKLEAIGRQAWIAEVSRPYPRNDNPADFEFRNIVIIEHADWQQMVAGGGGWDLVEQTLMGICDEAVDLIPRYLAVDPDAEVSIGTRRDWHDRPTPIIKRGPAT